MKAINNDPLLSHIGWKMDTVKLLEMIAQSSTNICIIGPSNVTLALLDNKIENHNVSSFTGCQRTIKMASGKTKHSIHELETFLKRNASCSSEIIVFDSNTEHQLGIIKKQASIFVPPGVCR